MLLAFVDTPQRWEHLTVFPVVASDEPELSYLLLAEAIQEGFVTLKENGSGTSPSLSIRNRGYAPVLILGCESLGSLAEYHAGDQSILLGPDTVTNVPLSRRSPHRRCAERQSAMLRPPLNGFSILDQQVGILAFLGRQLLGLDVLGSPSLYARLHHRLLNGHFGSAQVVGQCSCKEPLADQEEVEALAWAKKEGLARATGFSSHDRPHIKWMIETFTDVLDVIVTPYTAKTKVVTDKHGLWAAMQKLDVGWFGIKPYASGSVFKGDGSPKNPHYKEDNEMARLVIRYILCNQAITGPIPGMIRPEQVDNVALAVKERRELDVDEKARLDRAMDDAWANLPYHYQWLKDWEYV